MISSKYSYLGPNLICEGFVDKKIIERKLNTDGFVYNISTDENHSFIASILTQSSL